MHSNVYSIRVHYSFFKVRMLNDTIRADTRIIFFIGNPALVRLRYVNLKLGYVMPFLISILAIWPLRIYRKLGMEPGSFTLVGCSKENVARIKNAARQSSTVQKTHRRSNFFFRTPRAVSLTVGSISFLQKIRNFRNFEIPTFSPSTTPTRISTPAPKSYLYDLSYALLVVNLKNNIFCLDYL